MAAIATQKQKNTYSDEYLEALKHWESCTPPLYKLTHKDLCCGINLF